ncbi:MAG: hypothetical protein Q4D58_02085 [Synergistaceae bacterium]|nr:hypothetical protein [Synergistaceae bacterium]
MRKLLLAVLALTLFATLCLSQAAFAENFVEVDRTERNIAYLDTDSIKDEGGYVTAISKITIRSAEARAKFKERSGVEAHYFILTFAYNKAAKEDQLLDAKSYYGYEVTGSETRVFSADGWREIPAGTIGEIMYDRLMTLIK